MSVSRLLFIFGVTCCFLMTTCVGQVTQANTAGCGGNLTTPTGGPVTSTNYPSNYGNNENCEWLITVPEGSIIRLTFDSFNTEENYDFLTIYDGASDSAAVLHELTGQLSVSPVNSTSNKLFLKFTSDEYTTRQGFQFSYTSFTANKTTAPVGTSRAETDGDVSCHGGVVMDIRTAQTVVTSEIVELLNTSNGIGDNYHPELGAFVTTVIFPQCNVSQKSKIHCDSSPDEDSATLRT
ncbi:hypothetical protein Bbelb_313710 [Branchiostoma belcheri]|nr:hypothetical protein Bbelb_313710 [Branchiostoma belcheri]